MPIALLLNTATASHSRESEKEAGSLLDQVVDDDGVETYWIMAPKPGYEVPFDTRSDELMILTADVADTDESLAGVINAGFWNIGGDKFNTENCEMTLVDTDADTYWDSFTITEDAENCATYGGKTGLIQYILASSTYTSLVFDDTGAEWPLATYEEFYDTVDNGGLFWWDEDPGTTWSILSGGLLSGSNELFALSSVAIVASSLLVLS